MLSEILSSPGISETYLCVCFLPLTLLGACTKIHTFTSPLTNWETGLLSDASMVMTMASGKKNDRLGNAQYAPTVGSLLRYCPVARDHAGCVIAMLGVGLQYSEYSATNKQGTGRDLEYRDSGLMSIVVTYSSTRSCGSEPG